MEPENQNTSLFDLKFDEYAKEQLRGLSKWTMIVVIASVISLIVSIIKAFVVEKEIVYGDYQVKSDRTTNVTSAIIGLIIGGILAYLLYQFSVYTKRGVNNMSQADLNKGLGNLRAYFMTYGIIILIVVVIAFLLLLVVGSTSVLR